MKKLLMILCIGILLMRFSLLFADMTIDSSGNVGIGTTTPSSKFELAGDYAIDGITPILKVTSYADLVNLHPAVFWSCPR